MAPFDAAVLDVDGTIVRGEELIPGAAEGLRALEAAGVDRLLFSNNPTRGAEHYRDRLAAHGVEVDPANVLTSATVAAEYLAETHPGEAVFLVGHERLRAILEGAGLEVTADPEAADLVLGSIDPGLTYDALDGALDALERGLPFYGTDPDPTIPTADGRVPGSGTILAALEAAGGREPDAILGKPSAVAAEATARRLDVPLGDVLVVGDRLDTDVALGARAGMTTAVVLTGITDRADLDEPPVSPDHVLESLGEVGSLLDGEA